MKIKITLYSKDNKLPIRAHANDAGADVYMPFDRLIQPGTVEKIPLGFGLEVPAGYAGFVYPRGSMALKGLVCELPPIDPGYRGEIHAILTNVGTHSYHLKKGDRIGQLVITPVVVADFAEDLGDTRDAGAFGSTGK